MVKINFKFCPKFLVLYTSIYGKSSVLNHVYCNDATFVDHIIGIRTLVGDHNLVHFNIMDEQGTPKMILKRSWVS